MLRPRPRIALAGESGRLALEFLVAAESIRGQATVGEGGGDRTTGFAVVTAVAETAVGGDVDDVVERGVDAVVGAEDLEGPDPGGIDEQGAIGQLEQFAMGGRVAAT